ncbi:hypothetical protein [Streptomyces sp. NPDC007088]|uniref:hypothetical protein n=1 Tax=Streptomyces sp. NPDC007088 TaxID=3364773 RepID=UPI00369356F9
MNSTRPHAQLFLLGFKVVGAAFWGLVTRGFGPLDRTYEQAEAVHHRLDSAV